MTTFDDLTEEVLLTLEGQAGDSSVVGMLSDDVTSTDTSLGVVLPPSWADGSPFSAGLVEVGDELVNALAYDRESGVFASVLRGWRGTRAVAHPVGTIVRGNPKYPRHGVRRALNDACRALHPRVCAVSSVVLQSTGNQLRYPLPTGVSAVHSVSYEDYGGSLSWVPLRRYTFVPQPVATPGAPPSSALEVVGLPSGRRFQVVYFHEPTMMTNATDDFEAVTGLGSFARPAVVAHAVSRLFSSVELGRALTTTVDQSALNRQSPVGSTVQIARQLHQSYAIALTEAEERFHDLYPPVRTVEVW